MDSSVSQKDETWFLRVCHHISTGLYQCVGHDKQYLTPEDGTDSSFRNCWLCNDPEERSSQPRRSVEALMFATYSARGEAKIKAYRNAASATRHFRRLKQPKRRKQHITFSLLPSGRIIVSRNTVPGKSYTEAAVGHKPQTTKTTKARDEKTKPMELAT